MYIAYFDGACEPVNPGGTASYGAVIFRDCKRIWECSEIYNSGPGNERNTSNNVAEYAALIAVLEWFADRKLFHPEIMVYCATASLSLSSYSVRGRSKA